MPIPERITPGSLSDYFAVMAKAIMQAGMRWAVIDAKWSDFLSAFKGFDPHVVGEFTSKDIDRLSSDSRLLRSATKVKALVSNARRMVELDNQYGSFANYLHSFATYEELSANLKKNFKYMGELNVYYFLFRVSEPVPEFERWVQTIPGEHPRMKEMIEQDRDRLR